MILYHRTSRRAARAILRSGFRDAHGFYGVGQLSSGVWFSDRPLDMNEGAIGDTLLRVILPKGMAKKLRRYEWVEVGKPYREWQVPAVLVNASRTLLKIIPDRS